MNKYSQYKNPQALISPEEAYRLVTQNPTKYQIIDIRNSEDFSQGHASGAISLPANLIEQQKGSLRGEKINPLDFQRLLSSLGITQNMHLLLIDAENMVFAARLWWTLLIYGHKQVSIIDGGMTYWKNSLLPTTTTINHLPLSHYEVDNTKQDMHLAYLFEVLSKGEDTILLDVRSEEEHSGEACYEGASYGGAIPNAIFLPFKEFIDQTTMTIHAISKLQEIVNTYHLEPDMPIIVYCHAGTRASLVLFVLQELLGFSNIKNYNGSWIEYSHAMK